MTTQADESAQGLARSVMRCGAFSLNDLLTCCLVAAGLTFTAHGTDFRLGPLIQVSGDSPFIGCDPGGFGPGPLPDKVETEPFVVVNPTNAKNIAAIWAVGRYRGLVAGVSMDGGKKWERVVVPGLNVCSGGTQFEAPFNAWLSFAPNGDLHLITAVFTRTHVDQAILVCKSSDGGLHWGPPAILVESTDSRFGFDLPTITADPADTRFVYAIWDGTGLGHRGPAQFTRTTDAGRTWEPARAIVQTSPQDYVQFSQILVLADGTLVDAYELVDIKDSGHGIEQGFSLQIMRSTDRGLTWSGPNRAVTMLPLYGGPIGNSLVMDPDTGHLVLDPINPSFAVDRQNGALYAVWEDGRFSGFQYNDIALSVSADGGTTWSEPIRVNRTPLNIPVADRQAFLPSVAVAADGTVGVSYYDFRFNNSNPGCLTDRWLVHCHPSATAPPTDSRFWNNETRLTQASFDFETAPATADGYLLGVYFGLATAGNDFLAAFAQTHGTDPGSIFFRRVGP